MTAHRAGWLAIALGAVVALVALLGPLATGALTYHVSASATDQVRGGDAVALVLVAPVSVLAGVLLLRGVTGAAYVALAPAGYAAYTYAQLAVAGEPFRYGGNSERFFPLLLAGFLLAVALFAVAWRVCAALPGVDRRPALGRRLGTALLVAAAFLVLGLHLPGLVGVWVDPAEVEAYRQDPGLFWLVKFMDLAIVVPVLVLVGLGLRRGTDWAWTAASAVVGGLVLLAASVSGMAVVMLARDDPGVTWWQVAAFLALTAGLGGLAWRFYRPLVATEPERTTARDQHERGEQERSSR